MYSNLYEPDVFRFPNNDFSMGKTYLLNVFKKQKID